MDGSSLSLILIPIAAAIGLATWLILVYYADSHPQWGAESPAPRHAGSGAAVTAGRRPPDPVCGARRGGRQGATAGRRVPQPTSARGGLRRSNRVQRPA